ncbi:MAG: hypothetical protein Q4E28_04850 [Clostridia bacterium]|nr:hypothetical protein [Clostridia bacterium]
MENHSKIVKAFLPVLQMTDFFNDLENLEYINKTEFEQAVVATFKNGCKKEANVTYDSGVAMLRDILKQII